VGRSITPAPRSNWISLTSSKRRIIKFQPVNGNRQSMGKSNLYLNSRSPPSPMNYQTQIHTFKTADNERLHGALLTPPDGASDLGLIFVHGVAMNFYLPPLFNFGQILRSELGDLQSWAE